MFRPIEEMSTEDKIKEIEDLEALLTLSNSINVDAFLEERVDITLPHKYDLVVAPNGCFYDRTIEGFLPRLLSHWFDTRDEFKKVAKEAAKLKEVSTDPVLIKALTNKIADYDIRQKVYKVALNSAYGALANKWFRFYNFDLAESVT